MIGTNDDLKALVRTIPDFPKSGIQFRDITTLLLDAQGFAAAIERLACHIEDKPDLVAGIEARGFVVATAVALELRAGFVEIRKAGSVHPGPKVALRAPPDWRGRETELRVQRHAISPGDAVLEVDDWAETGSKAVTARRLIDACGGRYAGSVPPRQPPAAVRAALEPVAAVALAEEVRA